VWTFDTAAPFYIQDSVNSLVCSFEKIGGYVAINIPKMFNGNGSGSNDLELLEQGYIYIYDPDNDLGSVPVDSANKGTYKILQIGETEDFKTIWIKNTTIISVKLHAG